jgi:hypothetical protein
MSEILGRKFGRRFSLIVGNRGGQGLDLSEFAVQWRTTKTDIATPNTLSARIFNVTRATAALVQKEFRDVTCTGGYRGFEGTIFKGQIKQTRYGREDGATTYLDIFAATGDMAYNFGVINVTLAAGASAQDMLDEIVKVLEIYDIKLGFVATLPIFTLPRARTLHGMFRDVLTTLCESIGFVWSIQDDTLHLLPSDRGVIGGQALELNSSSGLIGMAEQTEDGIYGRCLLDARMFVYGAVKLSESSINLQRMNLSVQGEAMFNPRTIATDGIYRLLSVEHTGHTRGNEWYTDFVCLARGDAGGTSRASTIPGA